MWERRERDFRTHQAVASVATGVAVTLPDLQVTVDPGEAWQAGAGVAALACVHTRGPVAAGFVVGAVVQICKQTGGSIILSTVLTLHSVSLFRQRGGYTPWSQKIPPQPSLQVHCHDSVQVPCLQEGWSLHTSQKSPCQPFLHLSTHKTAQHDTNTYVLPTEVMGLLIYTPYFCSALCQTLADYLCSYSKSKEINI